MSHIVFLSERKAACPDARVTTMVRKTARRSPPTEPMRSLAFSTYLSSSFQIDLGVSGTVSSFGLPRQMKVRIFDQAGLMSLSRIGGPHTAMMNAMKSERAIERAWEAIQ